MAQITELQAYALPGQRHSFLAKEAALLVGGPFCVIAAGVFQPGGVKAETFQPGAVEREVFQPGAVAGEVACS